MMTREQINKEAKEYYNTNILHEECGCQDCCADHFNDVLPEMFEMFDIPFVPRKYEDVAYEYGTDEEYFTIFWKKLYDLQLYNQNMIRKKEQSDTNKTLCNCIDCGQLTYKNKNRIVDGMQLCIGCARHYKTCHFCNTLIKTNNRYNDSTSIVLSSKDDLKNVWCCNECYESEGLEDFKCGNCGSFTIDGGLKRVKHARNPDTDEIQYLSYCYGCSKDIKECSTFGCKELSFKGSCLCNSCLEKEKGIHSYNYKPLDRVFNYSEFEKNIDIKSALFFGFELETERKPTAVIDRRTMAHLVKQIVGKDMIYCMSDGSLADGIEIASFPFTWDWYKRVGKDKWTELLLFLKDKQWRGDLPGNNESHPVGFHVHTSKAAWSKLQIYKLIQFVYNPQNRNFMNIIAGRPPMQYCRISQKDFDKSVSLAKMKKNVSSDHYNMINLNKKSDPYLSSNTIEFRMFKGSIEPLIFHKNLEFIKAIFSFTQKHAKKEMFSKYFLKYVIKYRKEYPCLMEFLKKEGFIDPKTIRVSFQFNS